MASQQQQSGIAAFINSLGSDVQNNPVTQAIAKAIVGNKTPPTSSMPASKLSSAPLPPIQPLAGNTPMTPTTTHNSQQNSQVEQAVAPFVAPFMLGNQQVQNSAEQGSENYMGALQGAPEAEALSPIIGAGTDLATTAAKATGSEIAAGVKAIAQEGKNALDDAGGLRGIAGDLQPGLSMKTRLSSADNAKLNALGWTKGDIDNMSLKEGLGKIQGKIKKGASSTAFTDSQGNPLFDPAMQEPQNGDQFINPDTAPLQGGTTAQVKAKTTAPTNLQYNPGGAMKSPITEGEVATGLPPIQAKTTAPAPEMTASGEEAPSATTDYSRTYDVNNPEYATPSKEDLAENVKRNLTTDGEDIRDEQHADQINTTLNNYNIKGSQKQQSRMLTDSIDTLARRARANVKATGGTISKTDLINQVAKNLVDVSGKTDINPDEIMKIAEDQVNSSYTRVKGVGTNGELSTTAPDNIPGEDVQDMKKDFNGNASGTFGQPVSSWTKAQKVARPARDAIDALLDEQYPDASKLNNDMSDMYAAKDSLRKGSIIEGNLAQKAANTPKTPFSATDTVLGKSASLLPPIIKRPIDAALSTPKRALITGGVIGGAVALPPIANSFGQKKEHTKGPQSQQDQQSSGIVSTDNSQDKHSTSISNPVTNVNPYAVPDATAIKYKDGTNLTLNTGDLNNQVTALTTQLGQLNGAKATWDGLNLGIPFPGVKDIANKTAQVENLKLKAGDTQNIIQAQSTAAKEYRQLEQAKQLLTKAPRDFWTTLSAQNIQNPMDWMNIYRLNKEPAYSQYYAQIQKLQGQYNGLAGLTTSSSSDVAKSIIDQEEMNSYKDFQQTVKSSGGTIQQAAPARSGATKLKSTNFVTKIPPNNVGANTTPNYSALPPIPQGSNSQAYVAPSIGGTAYH